ncbi:PGPGW domain-containing protein [Actinomadura sediminis]|uniref:PGPGW domain-containing protein n=1 Tax=Actinomadura sediminis TaxID=1038904 RepID=A0ABW3EIV3_9ACTN
MARHVRRGVALVVGALLALTGVALLVLPGPGLLLVLAGLLVLAREFPVVQRYVDPVREAALRAAAESVSSPWRIAGSALTAAALFGAGVAWGLVDRLPFSGWGTGSGLILSGFILVGLLVWSHRRVKVAALAEPARPAVPDDAR